MASVALSGNLSYWSDVSYRTYQRLDEIDPSLPQLFWVLGPGPFELQVEGQTSLCLCCH